MRLDSSRECRKANRGLSSQTTAKLCVLLSASLQCGPAMQGQQLPLGIPDFFAAHAIQFDWSGLALDWGPQTKSWALADQEEPEIPGGKHCRLL